MNKDGYGLCPVCGEEVESRERRIDETSKCVNGHIFPSKDTVPYPKN